MEGCQKTRVVVALIFCFGACARLSHGSYACRRSPSKSLLSRRILASSGLEAPLLPMNSFFRNPDDVSHKISPDGSRIAFLRTWNTRMNIFIFEVDTKTERQFTFESNRSVSIYNWAGSKHIAYLKDEGGNQNYHVFVVNLSSGIARDLTPYENVRATFQSDCLSNSTTILVMHNLRMKIVADLYRADLDSGILTLIFKNPGSFQSFLCDHEGAVRLAARNDGLNETIMYRETENDQFETLVSTDYRTLVIPVMFTFDNKFVYALSNLNRDKSALVVIDPVSGKEIEVVYANPDVDVSNVVPSYTSKSLLYAEFVDIKRRRHFFNESTAKKWEALLKELPGDDPDVSRGSCSRDGITCVLKVKSDVRPESEYLYHENSNTMTKLGDTRPWINSSQMAAMHPVTYTSRDGLEIQGYVSVPRGYKPLCALPTVVLPHGGPWLRDTWGFDSTVQFLANRGYAVLQMNFRGSLGYGRHFWELSFKQWGRNMQHDISDGVQWLVREGIADRNRICIYGGSYGGYAALAGLAFTPGLYRCGVSHSGIANLFTFLDSLPPWWEILRPRFYAMIGDPVEDKDMLRSVSPIFSADRIRAPLFVAHGANDVRVLQNETDQIASALRGRGIEVPYMLKENEGHGFANEENIFDLNRAVEQFLARHLGGRQETGANVTNVLGSLPK